MSDVDFMKDLATSIGGKSQALNPIIGCTPVGPGCADCWAATLASRFRYSDHLTTKKGGRAVFTGRLELKPHVLEEISGWRRRRAVFLENMGDLFHKNVPDFLILRALQLMSENPQHLFVVATHRPVEAVGRLARAPRLFSKVIVPPENLIILVSVETPTESQAKIFPASLLRSLGYRVGLIYEPALAPGAHHHWDFAEWVILGALNGGKHQPISRDAFDNMAREVRDFCVERGIPFYLKQAPTGSGGMVEKAPQLDGRIWRQVWDVSKQEVLHAAQ